MVMKMQPIDKFLESAIPKNGNRPVLNFIWQGEDGEGTFACDGYCMHKAGVLEPNPYNTGLNHTSYTLNPKNEQTRITGRYPDIGSILSSVKSFDLTFSVDPVLLMNLMKFTNTVTKEYAYSTKFEAKDGKLFVQANKKKFGVWVHAFEANIPIQNLELNIPEEEETGFYFNLSGKYIEEGLRGLAHLEAVTFKANKSNPSIIVGEDDRLVLIMPMSN